MNIPVLRDTTELVASIPTLLGFQPTESAVICFFGADKHLILTARTDLGTKAHEDLIARVLPHNPTGAVIAVYSEHPSRTSERALNKILAAFTKHVEARIGYVRDGSFHELYGDTVSIDITPTALAELAFAGHNVTPAASRDEVIAELTRSEPNPVLESFITAHDGNLFGEATARQVEDSLIDYLTGHGPVSNTEHARWVSRLHDQAVREPALKRLASDPVACRTAKDRMVHLTQTTPRTERTAAAFAFAAALAWLCGSGVEAEALAGIGREADPSNVLAGLVEQGSQIGVDPNVFREMLTDMTLDELRKEG
jgi:hypothetical protein